MQRMFAKRVDDRMPSIVPSLKPNHYIRFLSKVVDDPTLALVAPLGSHDCDDSHLFFLLVAIWQILRRLPSTPSP
jgi:hypothetical protein